MKRTALESLRLRYTAPPPKVVVLYDGTPVAELTHSVRDGQYQFKYLEAFSALKLAPLPGLPELHKTYTATELFPYFEERIPDMRRPEIRELIKRMGISESDKLALLDALSRNAVTDSYELKLDRAA